MLILVKKQHIKIFYTEIIHSNEIKLSLKVFGWLIYKLVPPSSPPSNITDIIKNNLCL